MKKRSKTARTAKGSKAQLAGKRERGSRRQAASTVNTVPVKPQPTVLYPVVIRLPKRPIGYRELSNVNFRALERAGVVTFNPGRRDALENIATSWISHDQMLQSPRPHQFRERLKKIERTLQRAAATLDLNNDDATVLERHLHTWLLNASFNGVDEYPGNSISLLLDLDKMIAFLKGVGRNLPSDRGRRRPTDEDRFVIYLADQFEHSGGRARSYSSVHGAEGYGDTAFRRFVHQFYALLPLKVRRTRSGLDEVILRALKYRRKHAKKG